MDIWAWVEDYCTQLAKDGHQKLAYQILHLPRLVMDNRAEEVDRLVPALLDVARELEHPWLEVFVRHWNLHSRVRKRYEVKGLLPEALELIEFANRDETKGCPQSVCAVQDLTSCYADIDGPGYGQVRLEAAKTALDRIDTAWPCFRCISGEYAAALVDLDRADEAVAFCDRQLAAIGASDNPYDFREPRVRALIALDRLEDALALNAEAENPGAGESWLVNKTIDHARILARLGRFEEAKACLPDFDMITDSPGSYSGWVDAMIHIIRGGLAPNDWEFDLQVRLMAGRLEDQGALREAWRLQSFRVELALERERAWVARHAVEAMQRIAPQFEHPLDAPELTESADRRVAAIEARVDLDIADTIEENLKDAKEPDLDYERFRQALARWPDDHRLWLAWGQAAGVLGRLEELVASGREFFGRNPSAWQVAIVVGQTLVALEQLDAAEAWAEDTFVAIDDKESRAAARFIQALAAERRGDENQLKARLEQVLGFDPEARNTRSMLAELARNEKDYEAALEHIEVLLKVEPEVMSHHWDRIVAATMEDRWDIVRDSGAALGMRFATDEGPVDEEWGVVRVQMLDETGTPANLHTLRTGPVTGRIIEISPPELPIQFYGAAVIFDPRPLNPPDTDAAGEHDGDERPPLTFPLLDILHASPYRAFAVDGARPSEVQMNALRADLSSYGAVIQIRSGPDYRIQHATEEGRDAAYWYVAVLEDTPLEVVADRMEVLEEALGGPLVWPQLLYALGRSERLAEQERLISEWELM